MSVARHAWPLVLLTLIVPVALLSRLGSRSAASPKVREKISSASVIEKPLEFTVPEAAAAEAAAPEVPPEPEAAMESRGPAPLLRPVGHHKAHSPPLCDRRAALVPTRGYKYKIPP